ncbi:hypothetical protein SAMN05192574_107199 [Mucilaginibacter gossypiicola]|uniref:DUF2892 domain-containing protein n=1 Tax=Mucilaginibacter gossypiicola TaxID=551995 RepID=A0A1H8P305_9SPHI|nr:DUF2892 domain-containing protein [Mucilaginibacter gossypiicola]SEO35923.1 hypothetical protein SAMN05192574_107199 [Mucilaginibacter gossypiicola]
MKTLQLPPDPRDLAKNKIRKADTELKKAPVQPTAGHSKPVLDNFLKRFFPDDAPENLSTTEAVIRGALVFVMPVLSSIDWNYHTHAMIIIAPIIFYLEVTAFTLYCPVKRLFSNYTHPSKYE